MEVHFASRRLKDLLEDERKCSRRFGRDCARKIQVRLVTLLHSTTLAEALRAPGRCHALKHGRKGQYAFDLKGAMRLIIVPANDPLPRLSDGSLDVMRVTAVQVMEVTDYHD